MRFELGVIVPLREEVDAEFDQVARLALPTCQLACWRPQILSEALAEKVVAASRRTGVRVSSLWAGYSGPVKWNFTQGPRTIGLVPDEHRGYRTEELLRAADFARAIGAPSITTHVGFIPDDPDDHRYGPMIESLQRVIGRCGELGLGFNYETGQETPVTLLRTIEDVGLPGQGVNLDPANLILYGKANPVDALEVIGRYIAGVHVKDGMYPTNGRELGHETPVGRGRVDFRALLRGLWQLGYRGPLTIEREISGPQQEADIRESLGLLRAMFGDD